jgi:hypothetical protein
MDSFKKKFVTRTTKYEINGKEYGSLDRVPERFRSFFEDKDRDGCPDWIQSQMESMGSRLCSDSIKMTTINGATTYEVGGQEYHSLEEMPQQYRALFEDRDGDGFPDVLPEMRGLPPAGLPEEPPPAINPADHQAERRQLAEQEVRQAHCRRSSDERDFEFPGETRGNELLLLLLLLPIACLVVLLVLWLGGQL